MVLKNQKWDKVLELLFENPNKRFTIREISKETKVPTSSIQRYLKSLKEENLIDRDNKIVINEYSKFLKSSFMINKIIKSGLIEYLNEKLNSSVIIIFGGIRKGEYDNESDIDLFVESTKKIKIDLSKFEKMLKHNIQLFVEKDVKNLPDRLFNNVINGIKLGGYLKIK